MVHGFLIILFLTTFGILEPSFRNLVLSKHRVFETRFLVNTEFPKFDFYLKSSF